MLVFAEDPMEYVVAVILVKNSLTDHSKRSNQCHVQPQKSVVKWIIAAEAAPNKAEKEDYLQ